MWGGTTPVFVVNESRRVGFDGGFFFFKTPHLVTGSSEVESAEYDFPSKIHGIP